MESSTRMIFQRSPSFSSQSSALSMSGSLYSKGSMQRFRVTPSVYGGAGGHGTRISTSRQLMSYGGEFTGGDLFGGNEKTVMQSLNDRLASYLEKVQSLEQSNSKLEVLIRQWYEANAPITSRDYSAYYKQIEELQSQIKKAQLENAQYVLQIDNAKLAAEDFRLKYETERSFRVTVEADLLGLNKVLDDLTLSKTDLEVQIEQLTKDLIVLKKEHEEEVSVLSKQLGNNVNVEVDATPGLNLSTIMSEMREKYEGIVQKNLQEARHHFEIETKILQEQVTGSTEEIKEYEIQIKELRRTYQNLEIELQSQLSMKESLECTLEETNARYSSQLASIQEQLNSLEAHLMQMRADAVHQSQEYSILLDLKTRLEQEIATYRRLLEGDILVEKDPKKNRKVTTIVEEVVDGKVVSSEVRTVNENQ